MNGLVIAVHIVVCVLLITIILIQRGRGGGLVDTFSDVESVFGTKTNAFLTRITAVLSVLFFITCLSLAFISSQQSKSLLDRIKQEPAKAAPAGTASSGAQQAQDKLNQGSQPQPVAATPQTAPDNKAPSQEQKKP